MTTGDKVKVIKLDAIDKSDTNLVIGSVGEIMEDDTIGTYAVDFGNIRCDGTNSNDDGTYWMNENQLEVIEENGGNNNE